MDDLPVFGGDIGTLPEVGPGVDEVEAELEALPHLAGDLAHATRGTRREFRDLRQVTTAAEALDHIPAADEARHMVISGRFALWDFVPAVLTLAGGATVADLHVATLGFSKLNITEAAELLDAGKVGRLTLLASHYFRGTSTDIYDHAVATLAARRDRTRFLSIRTHAKILAMKLSDGRTVTIESSANARSCKNIEQTTAIGDPAVYQFHTGWIDQLFTQGGHHDRA